MSALIVLAVTNEELTRSCPAAQSIFFFVLHTLIFINDDCHPKAVTE